MSKQEDVPTVGEVLAPGIDKSSLEDAERMLKGFEDVELEERGEVSPWVTTATILLSNARRHYGLTVEGYRRD